MRWLPLGRVLLSLVVGVVTSLASVLLPAAMTTPAHLQSLKQGELVVVIHHGGYPQGRYFRSPPLYWIPVRREQFWFGATYWHASLEAALPEQIDRAVRDAGGASVVYQWWRTIPVHNDYPHAGTAHQLPRVLRDSMPEFRQHMSALCAGWPFRSAYGFHNFSVGLIQPPAPSQGTLTLPLINGVERVIPVLALNGSILPSITSY